MQGLGLCTQGPSLVNILTMCFQTHMGAVRKPLSVSLYKPEIGHIKVCKTLVRETCAEAARKKCERELFSELYCMFP